MPIYLDWLAQPSEQDIIDLDKLYHDAPKGWQDEIGQPLNAQWALNCLSQDCKLAMGRFNDKVVCAAWLIKQPEGSAHTYLYRVDKLCVRSITRERGVAKQLMVRLCQWAKENAYDLYVKDPDNGLSGLYELGFVQYEQGWRYIAH
ncbi:acetyl-CoA sensor PanZ family protein [Oceaniserpentilla sp. 4NH20-0058]|uniref:acetyl-CoA sensor PanZ family protein n=1 Tax=Oceaniserpentilla sp. 4NH20-0058 TaxID=3127660 RepID=UPI00310B6A47